MDKYIMFAFLFVVVVAGLGAILLDEFSLSQDYFNWTRSVILSRVNFLIAGLTPNIAFWHNGQDNFQETELDLSRINLKNLLPPAGTGSNEEGLAVRTETDEPAANQEEQQKEEIVIVQQALTLEQIEQSIKIIKAEADKIEKEVNELKTLVEIQEQINDISREVNILSQEIGLPG